MGALGPEFGEHRSEQLCAALLQTAKSQACHPGFDALRLDDENRSLGATGDDWRVRESHYRRRIDHDMVEFSQKLLEKRIQALTAQEFSRVRRLRACGQCRKRLAVE